MKKKPTQEQRVGVRELKAKLSAVLREVQSGQAILITEHGRPVGRIVPAEIPIEETLVEGARRGLWAWSGRKWQPPEPKLRSRGKALVSDLLLDDRE
jgi:prevent-host-death family protein